MCLQKKDELERVAKSNRWKGKKNSYPFRPSGVEGANKDSELVLSGRFPFFVDTTLSLLCLPSPHLNFFYVSMPIHTSIATLKLHEVSIRSAWGSGIALLIFRNDCLSLQWSARRFGVYPIRKWMNILGIIWTGNGTLEHHWNEENSSSFPISDRNVIS